MKLSLLDLSVNEPIEPIRRDCCRTIPTNSMNNVLELLLCVAVLELIIDVLHVVEVQFAFSLAIQEGEIGSSSFFTEGVALC